MNRQGLVGRLPEIMLGSTLAVSWLAAILALPDPEYQGLEIPVALVMSPLFGALFGWPLAWLVGKTSRKSSGALLTRIPLYLVGVGASMLAALLALRALWSFSTRGTEGFILPLFAVFGYMFLARLRKLEASLGRTSNLLRPGFRIDP
jgi:hypothetical protein